MIDSTVKEKCTGCKMCEDICEYKAINFLSDNEGFWYPCVDYNKCTRCGRCIEFCPAINVNFNIKLTPKVYAAWSNNIVTRTQSTSGGIYYEFASKFIDNGDHIVGAAYSSDFKSAIHICSNSQNGLMQIMGSKYFQSDTAGIYKRIKKLLEEGESVLFCGTPCQNAALSAFLIKDYESLIQCDFICRGINSPKAYKRFIETLEEKYKSKVSLVNFKNKKKGWNRFGTYIEFENGKSYFKDRYSCTFVKGYIEGNLFMRPSCHDCQFKGVPRVADLTLGDFWGVRKEGMHLDKDLGTSVVLVNSHKGEKLFESVKDNITSYELSIDAVKRENPCLMNSIKPGKNRSKFFENFGTLPFDKLVIKLCNGNLLKYYLLKIKRMFSSIKQTI